MMHWAAKYIGKPWALGAAGPHAFDCWHLCVEVQTDHYAHKMPLIGKAADLDVRRSLTQSTWRMVKAEEGGLQDGDVLSMQSADGPHVATVIEADGRLCVLHALGSVARPGAVVVTEIKDLSVIGFGRFRVWRYTKNA